MSRGQLFSRAMTVADIVSAQGAARADMAVLTRASVWRNIAGVSFPAKISPRESEQTRAFLEGALRKKSGLKNLSVVPLKDLDNAELRLIGEQLFSGPFYPDKSSGQSFIAGRSGAAALVNCEDHLTLFSFAPGFAPEAAATDVLQLEKNLSGQLEFATDRQFGYLSSNPERTGSCFKFSCVLHLGALHRTGRLDAALRHVMGQGFAWKALGGDEVDISSDFYVLSGPQTLSAGPDAAQERLKKAVSFLRLGEEEAGNWLCRPGNRSAAEDEAFRAAALLSSARLISYEEALTHISTLKTALPRLSGLICPPHHALNRLVVLCQPAHIAMSEGKKRLVPAQRDEKRACLLRQAFALEKNS